MRSRFGMSAMLAVLSLIIVLFVADKPQQAAAANITDGFDPGFIISDALFYDGKGMTEAQIQSFLNQRVSRCTLGDPGREKGKPTNWNGPTFLAQECLKDARFTTASRVGDAYCKAYSGGQNESAARIIAKVAQACNISPQVILITLEKEQSLVTDDWPTVKMFDIAMGFACPDTGPGNTANCDAEYFGFFNQVYWGARQFQVYKANPHLFNYQPFQNNTIQYHPNLSCGASTVYIENWATAALYIYTPYQPNAAALAAGWLAADDECAAYGNRNFYNFYKSWFGQPNLQFPIHSAIAPYANTARSWLGNPTKQAVTSAAGTYQEFSGGVVFAPTGGTPSGMTTASPILSAYRAAGFVTGAWGWPKGPAKNLGSSGNNLMEFAAGTVIESDGRRAILLDPQLLAHWNSSGGINGSLGAPLTPAKHANGATQQTFKKGTVVRDSAGAVRVVDARFYEAWNAAGGVSNSLGLPSGDATTITANGGGAVYPLTKGAMYSHGGTITTLPAGHILTAYTNAGGPASAWGWPTTQPVCSETECLADFTGGVAVWSSVRGSQFTPHAQIPSVTPDAGAKDHLIGGSPR